ncbi:MAG TPA: DUF4124 domain-containing protein [Woeseiaceae bacterium]|nr:DUF4124 domain-containing protein [Woeseiaceae bacterium]
MNRLHPIPAILVTTALAAAASAVAAADIYKWTDENGIVHFGDRPSGAQTQQVVHIQSDRTDPAKVQARVQARRDAAEAAASDEEAAAGEEPSEEELRAKERERAEKCAMYKERLQTFLTSRRLYREDENGERVYLNEEETLAARAKVQEQIVEYCD